jgi:hypothetical protein
VGVLAVEVAVPVELESQVFVMRLAAALVEKPEADRFVRADSRELYQLELPLSSDDGRAFTRLGLAGQFDG